MDASVYECSNSSYHSHWFWIAKKEAETLHPVHSLEPLNVVTIQNSDVTPFPEQIEEQFTCCTCRGMLDLYLAMTSMHSLKPLITTPYGALCLTKLPMCWTHAVPIFHDDILHILQPEVPKYTIPYINNVPICSPVTMYQASNGTFKAILENSSILHFIWEHFQNLNHIVQWMKYCGRTFSNKEVSIVHMRDHHCRPHPHSGRPHYRPLQSW